MVPQVVIVILRDGLICITVPRSQQFIVITAAAADDDDYYPIRGNLRSSIIEYALFSASTSIFIEYPISLSWLI